MVKDQGHPEQFPARQAPAGTSLEDMIRILRNEHVRLINESRIDHSRVNLAMSLMTWLIHKASDPTTKDTPELQKYIDEWVNKVPLATPALKQDFVTDIQFRSAQGSFQIREHTSSFFKPALHSGTDNKTEEPTQGQTKKIP